jgi:cell division protein ZapA
MDSLREMKEFDVLGYKIKIKPDEQDNDVAAASVVDYITQEADQLLTAQPQLDKGQAAILVALKIAGEKLKLEREFCDNVEKMRSTASDALQFIEEVSPTTI